MIYANFILLSDKGRKPLTRRVLITDINEFIANRQAIQEGAILRLCKSRGMTIRDLQTYGYNKIKFEIIKGE